jgi:hypothetical protein
LLQSLWKIPIVAKIFGYAYEEEKKRDRSSGMIRDGMDSKHWQHTVTPHLLTNRFTFVFSISKDGIQVTNNGVASVAPLLLTPRSIHPNFIKSFVLFLGVESVLKLTENEKKVNKNWRQHNPLSQIVFQLLIEEILENEKKPADMIDGFTNEEGKLKLIILNFCGDLRALPYATMGNFSSSEIGACPECDQEGIVCGQTCYYVGHVRSLPPKSSLRLDYENHFENSVCYSQFLNQPPPIIKTHEDILRRQKLAANDNKRQIYKYDSKLHSRKLFGGGYGSLSIFGQISHWNLAISPAFCLIHEMGNGMKSLFNLLFNSNQMEFTPSKLVMEHENKRFLNLKAAGDKVRAPWHVSNKLRQSADQIHSKCRFPERNGTRGSPRSPFNTSSSCALMTMHVSVVI